MTYVRIPTAFSVALVLAASAVGLAQTPPPDAATEPSVTGVLVDGERDPVAFANVLLMRAADSVLAKAELSDEDGSFAISVPDTGHYFLQVVMLGYDDYQGEPFALSQRRDLGTLTLEAFAKTLETAVVTAKKPFLEQQAGKLVVNVEGSITGQTGSATQLLQKVPGVVVRQGRVSLAGASSVSILIDGKPTRYMDVASLLRDLPASQIARIEVITQPGAAYDAQGGGVLNIVLKRNVRLGTNGSASLGLGRGTYDKLNANVQLSHRAGPVNAYGSVGYRRGSGFDQLLFDRQVGDERILQDNVEPFLPNTASLRGGFDYDLSAPTSVGVSGRLANTVDDATGLNTTRGYVGTALGEPEGTGTLRYDLATDNVNNQTRNNASVDAYYRFAVDTAGRKLEADFSYAHFARDGELSTVTRLVRGDFGRPIDDIRSEERGRTAVAAAQLDYTHPLAGLTGALHDVSLRTGVKYAYADVDADLRAERRPMASEVAFANAPGLTNRFLYREDIAAAYLSATAELGEVDLSAGLRYEHTFVDGENVTSDSAFARDYGGWFPSVGVTVPLNGSLAANAAYSYRLDRPTYSSLNPFVRYMDPLTRQRGNTALRPEYTHNAELGLSFDGQPFAKVAYSRTADAISMVTEQDPTTGVAEGYDANLDAYTRYGGQLFAPLSFLPRTDGYVGGMAYYTEYVSDFLGGQFAQSSWAYTGFANATVALPLDVKLELNFWIQSGGQEGILQGGTVYGSSAGLQRKFLDDQLTVGVSYEDGLFDPWDGRIRYQDQRFDIVNAWETDIVMLNVTYAFGNRYLKAKEQRESAAREVLERAGG